MGASQGLGEGGVGMGSQPFSVLCFQHLLCSFDTLTRRPPADSPEDTFSLICKNQMAGHFLPRHSHGADPKDPGLTEPASEKPFKSLSFSPQLGFTEMRDSGSQKARASFPVVKTPPPYPDHIAPRAPPRPPGDCVVLPQGSLEGPAAVSSGEEVELPATPCGCQNREPATPTLDP